MHVLDPSLECILRPLLRMHVHPTKLSDPSLECTCILRTSQPLLRMHVHPTDVADPSLECTMHPTDTTFGDVLRMHVS